jgi:dTDP-4-dehydrorhamnose reductase
MVRVLVTGAQGQLGAEVVAELSRRAELMVRGKALDVISASKDVLDVTNRDAVLAAITTIEPDVVIHPAAFTSVDACESDPDRAFAVNSLGTRHIAEAARGVGAHVVYVSTDYVFDGSKTTPYVEWDLPNPLSVYGLSKLGGERELGAGSTIVRTSWVCGRYGQNMVKTVLRLVASGQAPLRFVDDQHGCPTIASDLAKKLVALALERRPGIFHVTNQGATTWFEFVRSIVSYAGGDPEIVTPISTGELDPPRPAPRPVNSVLDNAALRLSSDDLLPSWQESTEALVAALLS